VVFVRSDGDSAVAFEISDFCVRASGSLEKLQCRSGTFLPTRDEAFDGLIHGAWKKRAPIFPERLQSE
jgi:hypothetical protein